MAVGSAGIREALANGVAVVIATDQPGHTPMRFLGRNLSYPQALQGLRKRLQVPVAVVTAHPNPADPERCGTFKVAEVLASRRFRFGRGTAPASWSRDTKRHFWHGPREQSSLADCWTVAWYADPLNTGNIKNPTVRCRP